MQWPMLLLKWCSVGLGVPGCLPRLFVALAHGSEHPSAEVLRLMVRLWAPAATRAGMAPWMFARGSILETEEAVVTNSPEENAMARAAKSVTMASLPRYGLPLSTE